MLREFGQIDYLMGVLYHSNPVFSTQFSTIMQIMVLNWMQWDTKRVELEQSIQVRSSSLGYDPMDRHFRIV